LQAGLAVCYLVDENLLSLI